MDACYNKGNTILHDLAVNLTRVSSTKEAFVFVQKYQIPVLLRNLKIVEMLSSLFLSYLGHGVIHLWERTVYSTSGCGLITVKELLN